MKENRTHSKEFLDTIRVDALIKSKELYENRVKLYNESPKLCKNCGKPLTYEQFKCGNKFCSSSCSASWNNSLRKTTSKNREENRHCLNCGNLILKKKNDTWQDYNRRLYCSLDCKWEHERKDYIQKWKDGLIDGMSGDDVSERVRKYLIQKAGNKCSECGWHEVNPYTNKVPLEIHHIDGNPYNNSEDNLKVLCPNCHSLTPSFKGNRGNGRYIRKLNNCLRKENLNNSDESNGD